MTFEDSPTLGEVLSGGAVRNLAVGLAAILAVGFLSSALGFAYTRSLTPEDIKAAVEYGKTRRGKDLVDSTSPYSRTLTGVTGGFATLYTPWLEIASIARKAASEYRDPTEADVQAALSTWTGKLRVSAYIADQGEKFWDNSHGVILQAGQATQPIQKEAHFAQVVSCRASPCLTAALFYFVFPDEKIDNSGQIDIVIVLRGGYKEAKATFNLSELR